MNREEARIIVGEYLAWMHDSGKQESTAYFAIETLLQEQSREWIPCSERLPEDGLRQQCVVLSSDRKYPLVWGWMGNNWAINVSDPQLGSHKNITHWMPLPKPPCSESRKNREESELAHQASPEKAA